MKRFGIFVLLIAAMFANSKYAYADPLLSLGSRDALPGQSVFMDLQLSGGAESYAPLFPENPTVRSTPPTAP